jgi:hypothetical protein
MKFLQKIWSIFLCLVFFFSIAQTNAVKAQDPENLIHFSPDPSYIYMDGTNQVTVNVMIRDAIDVSAFDVQVNFDPTKVTRLSYELGDFLKNTSCIDRFVGPNYFRLICGQLATDGQNGTGTLFRIVFQGVTEGVTPLEFTETHLSNRYGQALPVSSTNGTLNVVNTGNLLYLPLILNIAQQGQSDRGGITLYLGRGLHYGLAYSGVSTNIPGENLTIPAVAADSYLLTTNQPRVLNITADLNKTATITSEDGTLTPLMLRGGNAVWTDNVIDIHDLTMVTGGYLDPDADPNADVNFDGVVNLIDIALVAGNFGLSSQTAYANWIP